MTSRVDIYRNSILPSLHWKVLLNSHCIWGGVTVSLSYSWLCAHREILRSAPAKYGVLGIELRPVVCKVSTLLLFSLVLPLHLLWHSKRELLLHCCAIHFSYIYFSKVPEIVFRFSQMRSNSSTAELCTGLKLYSSTKCNSPVLQPLCQTVFSFHKCLDNKQRQSPTSGKMLETTIWAGQMANVSFWTPCGSTKHS